MIERLVIFGASGDLTGRYLLPALAALEAADRLPDGLEIAGAARENWDDAVFQSAASERLDEHAADLPAGARERLVGRLRYRRFDLEDPASVARAVSGGAGPVAAYLALPPGIFPEAVRALDSANLPQGSRIALEKPFAEDLSDARSLNRLLGEVAGPAGEQALFRVDHVLGMATTQNLLALRFANRFPEAVWNSEHIDVIEILWEETLGLEGRAGYFDNAGALKDVLQNHAMQLLALVAMEPPVSLGEEDLRDAKVAALRAVRELAPDEVARRTRRGRYTAGEVDGRDIPSYVEEEGVDPERGTETFAEIELEIDSARWAGTRFVLRGGKALSERCKAIVVHFRPVEASPFDAPANELRVGIDGPEDITLRLTGSPSPVASALTLAAAPPATELSAYARVLLDLLDGDGKLSVRGDEAEEAWRVVTPVLTAWADDAVPLEDYTAGSDGPRLALL